MDSAICGHLLARSSAALTDRQSRGVAREVTVVGHVAVRVLDLHQAPEAALAAAVDDPAVGHAPDRCSGRRRVVDPLMGAADLEDR